MKKFIINKNQRGFTLPEVLVTASVFLLFSLALLGILTMGMRYFNRAEADILAQQNCRDVLEIMSNELRQGNPCPDTGQGSYPPRGYLGVTPALDSTAVLFPNKNSGNTQGDYMEFTVPNYQTYDPADTSFDRFNPYYYKKVKYSAVDNGKRVVREVTTYQTNGNIAETKTGDVAVTETGQIILLFDYISETTFKVSVTATEGMSKYSGESTVYMLVK